MESARFYHCALCHQQVVICSTCDRGNIYCGPMCSRSSRVQSLHRSNNNYQKSIAGRKKHAARQADYRQRHKKVTDHGSPTEPPNDLLPSKPDEPLAPKRDHHHCHFCGRSCSAFVRQGFLTKRWRDRLRQFSFWRQGP